MTKALYRRYRPETFQEVIGQEHVIKPLMAALAAGNTNHAYLFSGPRGCGKTTSARILARCLNCAEYPTDTPCGECDSCRELSRDGSGSLDVVELDAASHGGVDDARELREQASFAPVRDRFKIYIIDEAHMVSNQGFNALLKLVEEPPPHVKFIFATTEPEKVIDTIRSRTHHYPFRLVPPAVLEDYLTQVCRSEGMQAGRDVLSLVVRAGTGSVRDTLSVLDQIIGGSQSSELDYDRAVALLGYTSAHLLDQAVTAIAAHDGAALFTVVDEVVKSGHDPRRFVEDLLQRLRDVVIIALAGDSVKDVFLSVPDDQYALMVSQADELGAARASRAADLVNEALTAMVGATAPRMQLELLCARLVVASEPAGANSAQPSDSARVGGGSGAAYDAAASEPSWPAGIGHTGALGAGRSAGAELSRGGAAPAPPQPALADPRRQPMPSFAPELPSAPPVSAVSSAVPAAEGLVEAGSAAVAPDSSALPALVPDHSGAAGNAAGNPVRNVARGNSGNNAGKAAGKTPEQAPENAAVQPKNLRPENAPENAAVRPENSSSQRERAGRIGQGSDGQLRPDTAGQAKEESAGGNQRKSAANAASGETAGQARQESFSQSSRANPNPWELVQSSWAHIVATASAESKIVGNMLKHATGPLALEGDLLSVGFTDEGTAAGFNRNKRAQAALVHSLEQTVHTSLRVEGYVGTPTADVHPKGDKRDRGTAAQAKPAPSRRSFETQQTHTISAQPEPALPAHATPPRPDLTEPDLAESDLAEPELAETEPPAARADFSLVDSVPAGSTLAKSRPAESTPVRATPAAPASADEADVLDDDMLEVDEAPELDPVYGLNDDGDEPDPAGVLAQLLDSGGDTIESPLDEPDVELAELAESLTAATDELPENPAVEPGARIVELARSATEPAKSAIQLAAPPAELAASSTEAATESAIASATEPPESQPPTARSGVTRAQGNEPTAIVAVSASYPAAPEEDAAQDMPAPPPEHLPPSLAQRYAADGGSGAALSSSHALGKLTAKAAASAAAVVDTAQPEESEEQQYENPWDEVSPDDPEISQSSLVGLNVVLKVFPGSDVTEIVHDAGAAAGR
ncbi:MAG: DNA polymerase III subunit gamma and tau [Actinomycetaceae bacterium]|nr:DNA polymerase III subunit gamma and tau [Actinomycetaceae bacterium]